MSKKDKSKKIQGVNVKGKTAAPLVAGKAVSSKKSPAPSNTRPWLPIVLAVVLAILTYVSFSPSNENGWTNWDDPVYVTENTMLQKNETPWNDIFTKPISNNYHPLTMLTLSWNYQSAAKSKDGKKIDATVFHEWNVWIHVFNTLLVFYFIWLLSGGQLITTVFTAAIFGLHPMHVESVSWISERKDVLYTFFFVLSCISYLWYLNKRNLLYLVLSFVLFGLSCLSKAMAVVVPLVFFAIDYLRARRWEWRIIVEKIPFLLLSLLVGLKAYHVQQGSIASIGLFTLYERFMFGSYGAVMYIIRFFAPFSLSTFYPYPSLPIPTYFYFAPLIWLVLGVFAWIGYKKDRVILFGIAFFIINVILVLQFMSVGSAIMADRYTYISYIGIAFILGSICNTLIKKHPVAAVPTYLVCSLFIIFLATQTYARTQVWKNNGTLWSDVISKYPTSEVAYKNRGLYYKELGDIDHMYSDYMVLKMMNTKDSRVYSNMGNIYGMRNQLDSAMWAYNRSLALDSKNEDAYMNRGITYSMMKQYDSAIADFNNQEKLAGVTDLLLQNRAYTYLSTGKYQQSLDDYNKLIAMRPNDGLSFYNRAVVEEQLGNDTQAYADLQSAVANGYKVDDAVMQRIKEKAGK